MTEAAVVKALGEPRHKSEGALATKYLPDASYPRALPPTRSDVVWDYPGLIVYVSSGRVFGLSITDDQAHTAEGVGIGDDLARVKEHVDGVDCEPADYSEYGSTQKCDGRLGSKRHVWIGGDPVDVIQLLERPV